MPPVHERLLVYQRGLELAIRLERLAQTVPASRKDLQDQLRRASASIPLNIAEGANEISPSEKARFYRIARRSCAECQAILDVLAGIGVFVDDAAPTKSQLNEVTAMLTTMVLRRARS